MSFNVFRNMSIRGKVLSAFGFVLALVVALGVYGIDRLADVNASAAEIRDNWLPATHDLGVIGLNGEQFRARQGALMMARTDQERANAESQMKDTLDNWEAAWRTYEPTVVPGEERQLVDEWSAAWKQEVALSQQLATLVKQNEHDKALALYNGEMRDAMDRYRTGLQKDLELNTREGVKEANRGAAKYASARWWIIGCAVLAAILCLAAGLMIVAGVSKPVSALAEAMRRLAANDMAAAIPGVGRADEIGHMASAVQVFKDSMIESERLRAEQEKLKERAAAERKADMQRLAQEFEATVGEIVGTVSSSSTELEAAAATLSKTADTTQQLSTAVAAASEQASANVQSVASATEELTSSVTEIGRQVQESSRISTEAVGQAQTTDDRITKLAQAANRIGDVTQLITSIAEQTNLLALNATIEAARAGEAGKGFAVVAQEVKQLAAQTAKATNEISAQIAEMQSATQDSVSAIKEIGGTISRISGIATAIASAVEEQGAATQEITRNVQQAASGTQQVSGNIADVSRIAAETGSASSQVLTSAQSLANESNRLKLEINKFLATVRAG
jgi:methyl-accepting chemotaxis protein